MTEIIGVALLIFCLVVGLLAYLAIVYFRSREILEDYRKRIAELEQVLRQR